MWQRYLFHSRFSSWKSEGKEWKKKDDNDQVKLLSHRLNNQLFIFKFYTKYFLRPEKNGALDFKKLISPKVLNQFEQNKLIK